MSALGKDSNRPLARQLSESWRNQQIDAFQYHVQRRVQGHMFIVTNNTNRNPTTTCLKVPSFKLKYGTLREATYHICSMHIDSTIDRSPKVLLTTIGVSRLKSEGLFSNNSREISQMVYTKGINKMISFYFMINWTRTLVHASFAKRFTHWKTWWNTRRR